MPKLTLPQLERHLYRVADDLRGKMDAAQYKNGRDLIRPHPFNLSQVTLEFQMGDALSVICFSSIAQPKGRTQSNRDQALYPVPYLLLADCEFGSAQHRAS